MLNILRIATRPTTGKSRRPVRTTSASRRPAAHRRRPSPNRRGRLRRYRRHVYGATETGPLVTTSDARRFFEDGSNARFGVKKRQGIGYLGTDVRVVDEDGNDVPHDDESLGEVVVRGNQVMEKYWNKPEQTEEAFYDRVEGYYHMGDLAVVDEDGMIAIQDRKKDIIISGGENISSIELEDTLFDHDAVGDVAVIPAPSDEWGETPKAFVVPNGDPDNPGVTAEDLRVHPRTARDLQSRPPRGVRRGTADDSDREGSEVRAPRTGVGRRRRDGRPRIATRNKLTVVY